VLLTTANFTHQIRIHQFLEMNAMFASHFCTLYGFVADFHPRGEGNLSRWTIRRPECMKSVLDLHLRAPKHRQRLTQTRPRPTRWQQLGNN